MKKVIVTGGSGFIGSNLINILLKKNFFVINIDKQSYSSSSYMLKKGNKKNYKFYKIDINNQKKIISILKKFCPSAIYNLAAETHVDRSIDDPSSFIKSNILGVYNLLESIKYYKSITKKNIKLIHVSTDEVYGDIKKNKKSNEKFAYNPSSPYSASKASADHLIKSYIRTYKIKALIVNCCNNYGPGQFPEKLIPTLIYNALNNKPLPIYGNGKNVREWIYVKDHCNALIKLYKKGKNGENYNVGSNMSLDNNYLAQKLVNIIKKKIPLGKKVKIMFVKDRPGHDVRYSLDTKKIDKLFKIKNKKIDEGLSITCDWYLKNYSFFKKFSKKDFYKRLGLNK